MRGKDEENRTRNARQLRLESGRVRCMVPVSPGEITTRFCTGITSDIRQHRGVVRSSSSKRSRSQSCNCLVAEKPRDSSHDRLHLLAEIATLIRMRDKSARGHRTAVSVANSLISRESAYLEKIAADDIAAGFSIFRKYSDHWFSFVDCTSFAVIERLGISQAFAFDGHFDQYPAIRRVP